jgi:hypothetical protein
VTVPPIDTAPRAETRRRCEGRRGGAGCGPKHASARGGLCLDRRRANDAGKPQVASGVRLGSHQRIVRPLSFYDPATGQFLTRDPLNALTRSAYGYVGGNPLNRVDPSGLDWSCITNPGSCDLPIPDSWEEALGSHTAHQVRAGAAVMGTIALVVAGAAYVAGAGAGACRAWLGTSRVLCGAA